MSNAKSTLIVAVLVLVAGSTLSIEIVRAQEGNLTAVEQNGSQQHDYELLLRKALDRTELIDDVSLEKLLKDKFEVKDDRRLALTIDKFQVLSKHARRSIANLSVIFQQSSSGSENSLREMQNCLIC